MFKRPNVSAEAAATPADDLQQLLADQLFPEEEEDDAELAGLGAIVGPEKFQEEEDELAGLGSEVTFAPAETELADRLSRISVSRVEHGGATSLMRRTRTAKSRFGTIEMVYRDFEEESDRAQPLREKGEKREARKQEAAAALAERPAYPEDLPDTDAELAEFQHCDKRRAREAREEAGRGRGRESNRENQTPFGTPFQMFRQPAEAAGEEALGVADPADPDKMGVMPMIDEQEGVESLPPVTFGFGGASFG